MSKRKFNSSEVNSFEEKTSQEQETPTEIHKEESMGKSPWMYTTLILAIVSLGLVVANVQITGYMLDNMEDGMMEDKIAAAPQPTPTPTGDLTDDDTVKGDANAPVTIVEFSDFECPFCGRFYTGAYQQLLTEYVNTGKAKIIFRDFPLSFHANAQPAAEAAECAGEQGMYWEMHDKIFENQRSLTTENYKKWAEEMGLNKGEFDACVDSGKMRSEVQKDFADGAAAGVSGTPTVFINGEKIVGAQPFEAFKSVIDKYL